MRRAVAAILSLATAALTALSGCGDNIRPVRGVVTWHGQPVPAGVVQFEPAKALGDVPTGFALIKDGRFVTEPGRGCYPGPHVARLKGFDGNPAPIDEVLAAERVPGYEDEPSLAVGAPLFENVTIDVDITPGGELSIDLPTDAAMDAG